jgi:hypothetical protein
MDINIIFHKITFNIRSKIIDLFFKFFFASVYEKKRRKSGIKRKKIGLPASWV